MQQADAIQCRHDILASMVPNIIHTFVYFTTKVNMTKNIKYGIKLQEQNCKLQTHRQRRREIKTIGTVIETYHTHYEVTDYHI